MRILKKENAKNIKKKFSVYLLILIIHNKQPCTPRYKAVLLCVPSMALILLVQVQSRVFTAKCSEPQAGASNGMGEGSGVAKFLSLRTET